jgi:hypothetical protein
MRIIDENNLQVGKIYRPHISAITRCKFIKYRPEINAMELYTKINGISVVPRNTMRSWIYFSSDNGGFKYGK